MQHERQICCCGASSWTKIIAWFHIIGNGIIFAAGVIDIVGHDELKIKMRAYSYEEAKTNSAVAKAVFALVIIVSITGIIMGIILLMGTNKKRVGYLKIWMIYCMFTIVVNVVSIILQVVYKKAIEEAISAISSGVFGVAFNAFCLIIVYIHIKEIKEGVFRQGYVFNEGSVYTNQNEAWVTSNQQSM